MVIATQTPNQQKLPLAEFLSYHDGTDTRYELVEGELKPRAIGTGLHGAVIEFVNDEFCDEIKRLAHPWTSKQAAVAIQSPRRRRWETWSHSRCDGAAAGAVAGLIANGGGNYAGSACADFGG